MRRENIRIIIVDDHQLIRETWKLMLHHNSGLEVIAECDSGAKAIELAPELNPDVILMDINMSPVNGFEATRKICLLTQKICFS
jgi:two-component system, NarL family, invasion response regulator UvrY